MLKWIYGYQYYPGARLWRVLENGSLAAEYLYSPNGRRSGGNIRGQSVNASYDVQDRLTNYNGTSYTYNPNGELIFRQTSTGATRQYLWNNRGQLNGVNIGSQNIRYIVDRFGRRLGKRGAGTMNRSWSYRNDLQIAGEFDETNTRKWFFIYGSLPHVPDYMVHAVTQERYRFIHDHVGSVVMLVNSATGVIAQSLKYDEFGRVLSDSNPGFQPFGFAGGLYDHDTGLVRFGARDYDAEIGRWITKDPILFNGGDMNLYGYVANDPINLIDPTGLFWFRQDWQEAGRVGRPNTIVPPQGAVSNFIEQYVPAGYTFGESHDSFVDWSKSKGAPDWLINIPSMIPAYVYAVGLETSRSLGLANQPEPVCK